MSEVDTKVRPAAKQHNRAICADFDADCEDVSCKVSCWLYDPDRGHCPYLFDVGPEQKAGRESE